MDNDALQVHLNAAEPGILCDLQANDSGDQFGGGLSPIARSPSDGNDPAKSH